MVRSASFTNIVDALKFGKNHKTSGQTLKPPPPTLLPRPSSAVDLHHTRELKASRTKTNHIETSLIQRILEFCDDATLARCLCVSRLVFNLAGHLLYAKVSLQPYDFYPVLQGSSSMEEAVTGRVVVGRRKFKDRLLRHTETVTIYSHGDDVDDKETDCDGPQELCPPIALSTLFPKLVTLRVVMADAYDYHLTFCSRFPHRCPLFTDLYVEKVVILGARSPLPVLPLAFPKSKHTAASPGALSPPLLPGSPTSSSGSSYFAASQSTLTTPLHKTRSRLSLPLAPLHKTHSRSSSAQSTMSLKLPHPSSKQLTLPPIGPAAPQSTTQSPRLPPVYELSIVMPSGLSYDAKDYNPYSHCFRHRKSLESVQRLSIVFYTPRHLGHRPWQTAFYDARRGNSWTSIMNLVDDLAGAALAVPNDAVVVIVGTETLDGESLNMGVSVVRDKRTGEVIEERVRTAIEVKWRTEKREPKMYKEAKEGKEGREWKDTKARAKEREREKEREGKEADAGLRAKLAKVHFLRLKDWLESEDGADVEGWDYDEWSK